MVFRGADWIWLDDFLRCWHLIWGFWILCIGVLDPLYPLLVSYKRFVLSLLFGFVNLLDLLFFVDVCLLCCHFMYYLIDFLFLFSYCCFEGCHVFASFTLCWPQFSCFHSYIAFRLRWFSMFVSLWVLLDLVFVNLVCRVFFKIGWCIFPTFYSFGHCLLVFLVVMVVIWFVIFHFAMV